MAVDVESKYLYNGFSYLGKDWTRSGDASLPTDVCGDEANDYLFTQGFNFTCDNYFTSLDLLLSSQSGSAVWWRQFQQTEGRKIPDLLKKKLMFIAPWLYTPQGTLQQLSLLISANSQSLLTF